MSWKGSRRLLLILLSMLIICSAWILEVQLATGSQSNDLGWTVASYSPYIGNYAVAVTGAGENIYIANSTKVPGVNYFMRYNTVENNWGSVSNPPQWFKNGTALAWDGGNYIYAPLGASYNDIEGGGRFYFYRYDISSNSWTQLANTPHTCGPGDALSFVPGWVLGVSDDNFLYAILGSNEPSGSHFYRYSIAGGSWSAAISFPWDNTDDGCSLVWAGDSYLYALRGEYHETTPSRDFARFKLADNSWENLPPIPDYGGVGDGGSMIWVGGDYGDYVFALGGGGANEVPGKKFYSYKISENSWIELADLPAGVGDQTGSRLGFSEGNIYTWRGSYGDPVLWIYTPVHPNVATLTPIDDSFVHESRSTSNFGSWDTIYVGRYTYGGTPGAERSFLKFDLSGISDNDVVEAKLYLYCWQVDDGGATIQGHRVDNDNWYEDTITWNNMPAVGGIIDGPHSVDNRGQYSWTVTDFVAEQLTDDKIASFCLIDNGENNAPDHAARFDSKEWTDNFQRPYLKITYAPPYGVDVSISLATLYEVSLEMDAYIDQGSKLVFKFYTYADIYEGENIVWSGVTPDNVSISEIVPHPENKAMEKVRLVLTGENTENEISTIASFTVRRVTLETRFMEIPFYWAMAGPEERIELESEFMEIPFYWAMAPS